MLIDIFWSEFCFLYKGFLFKNQNQKLSCQKLCIFTNNNTHKADYTTQTAFT